MRKTGKTNLLLCLFLVLFSAGTLALKLTENREKEKEEDTSRKVYYLTAYDGPEDLQAVQVGNDSGTLTVVHVEDDWITDTELPGTNADEEACERLFETAARIRVSRPIEGAVPEDEQFGLTVPSANVFVQDKGEQGIRFLIGRETPDGSGYYVCASGGKEVCTIPGNLCEAFLGDVQKYLDLRVFADIEPSRITKLSVSDPEGKRFELAAAGKGQITGERYYSLSWPVRIPVPLSEIREMFESIKAVRKSDVLEGMHVTEEELLYELSITQEGEDERSWRIGYMPGRRLCIEDESAGQTCQIGELPAWLAFDAAGILGGSLLSLNASDVMKVTLEADGKTAAYDFSGKDADPGVIDELNQIPIVINTHDFGNGKETLRCSIKTNREEEELELVFYEAGDRQAEISVNGRSIFLCNASYLKPLTDRIAGA